LYILRACSPQCIILHIFAAFPVHFDQAFDDAMPGGEGEQKPGGQWMMLLTWRMRATRGAVRAERILPRYVCGGMCRPELADSDGSDL